MLCLGWNAVACTVPHVGTPLNEPDSRTLSDEFLEINAHRNLRGAYTAAIGVVLRLLEHPSIAGVEELFQRRRPTLLLVCPELANSRPISPEVRKWLTLSGEGNPSSRTLKLAQGLTDFILDCAAHLNGDSVPPSKLPSVQLQISEERGVIGAVGAAHANRFDLASHH